MSGENSGLSRGDVARGNELASPGAYPPGPADEAVFATQDLMLLQSEMARNYAELEGALAAERQRGRQLEALYSATLALISTLDLEDLLKQVVSAAMHAIPAAEKSALLLRASDPAMPNARVLHGFADAIRCAPLLERLGFGLLAMRERKAVRSGNLEPENIPAIAAVPELLAIHSAAAAPLIAKDQPIGMLTLLSARRDAFSEMDLRLLESFAATASAAINNAYLHRVIRDMAGTDPLTGLANRRRLFELGVSEFERARRYNTPLSVVMLDLDNFKRVNDSHGHKIGDRVLVAVVDCCRGTVRKMDTFGRYGGEEFALILPNTRRAGGGVLAERLRQTVEAAPIETEHGVLSVTASFGVASLAAGDGALDDLLARADKAMYEAKRAGRNRVCIV